MIHTFLADNWGICVRITDCWSALRLLRLIITPVTSSFSGVCKRECKRVQVKLASGFVTDTEAVLKIPIDQDTLCVKEKTVRHAS